MYKTVLVSVTLTVCVSALQISDPLVKTSYGIIRGSFRKARNGQLYYSFKGIPYAKPPIGDLRFRPPKELDNWKDVLVAQSHSPHCIQKNYLFSNDPRIEGSEDCLYLNVYTRKLSNNSLPVMVFIHWGGFFAGYSSSDYIGPDYLMEADVVLVTFNYRLGIFGFLSSGDDASPGNYGLKDQVAVLKWVQKNIQFFGGNKSEVTIFGQSAGGASVHYHMLSPMSKGLFKRAISMSGTALALWATPVSADIVNHIFLNQARFANCATINNTIGVTKKMVECMRKMDANELLVSCDKFKTFVIEPLSLHLPAVEKRTRRNPEPFITKLPIDYIRNKEANFDVDWLIGVTDDEGLIRAEALIRQSETRKQLNMNFDLLMPQLLVLHLSMPLEQIPKVWSKMKTFYSLGDEGIDVSDSGSMQGLVNLYTDRSFGYSTYQAALLHELQGHSKIRFYNFNYTGRYTYGSHFAATNETVKCYLGGISHGDDLIYIFKTPALFPDLVENDKTMSYAMVNLFTNFSTYGDPMHSICNCWETINSEETKLIRYMDISGHYVSSYGFMEMKRGIHPERVQFWEELPLYENIAELKQYTQYRTDD